MMNMMDIIKQPEPSEWSCHLFGSTKGHGLVWTPIKGKEPCWFWRQMQWIVFGNRWTKNTRG